MKLRRLPILKRLYFPPLNAKNEALNLWWNLHIRLSKIYFVGHSIAITENYCGNVFIERHHHHFFVLSAVLWYSQSSWMQVLWNLSLQKLLLMVHMPHSDDSNSAALTAKESSCQIWRDYHESYWRNLSCHDWQHLLKRISLGSCLSEVHYSLLYLPMNLGHCENFNVEDLRILRLTCRLH